MDQMPKREPISDQQDSNFQIQTPKYHYKKWTDKQNRLYMEYLQKCLQLEEKNEKNERAKKFYINMAVSIGTKNNKQCRNHHIRLVEKYETKQEIIDNLMKKLTNFGNNLSEEDKKEQKNAEEMCDDNQRSIAMDQNEQIPQQSAMESERIHESYDEDNIFQSSRALGDQLNGWPFDSIF